MINGARNQCRDGPRGDGEKESGRERWREREKESGRERWREKEKESGRERWREAGAEKKSGKAHS
jgi:hypothetical protein